MPILKFRIYHIIISLAALMALSCNKAQVIYAERKDIVEAVYASGKIIPENEFVLGALSNGAIIQKLVKDGDRVRKGQLLYIVSNEAAKVKYDAALKNYNTISANLSDNSPLLIDLKLSLENASMKSSNDSTTYYRYRKLWEEGIGTRSNLDNVFTNYQVSLNQKKIAGQKYLSALADLRVAHSNAHSQLTSAGKDLREYFIRSDRDGMVYQTFKEAGETVYANETVALIGDFGNQMVRLAVDQQDINKIRIGQNVLLQIDVAGDTVYEARVSHVYRVMNEQDQTFRVDAVFTHQVPPSFVHSSAEANIIIQKKRKALVIPREALSGTNSVWIREKGSKKKTAIRTGIATLDSVEVISGLDDTTPVVLVSQNQ